LTDDADSEEVGAIEVIEPRKLKKHRRTLLYGGVGYGGVCKCQILTSLLRPVNGVIGSGRGVLLPHGFQAVVPFSRLGQQISGTRVNQFVGMKNFESVHQT
jgi:hypothetical protein